MRLEELAAGCLEVPVELRDLEVSALTCESRRVVPGTVFVAVRGTSSDGHAFVEQAARAGAVAVVGDRIRLPQENRPASDRGQIALARLEAPYMRVTDARSTLGRLGANFYGQAQRSLRLVGVTGTKGKTTTAWILDSIFRAAGELGGGNVIPTSNTRGKRARHQRPATRVGASHSKCTARGPEPPRDLLRPTWHVVYNTR